MEYGISINFFIDILGLEKATELVAKAGFTHLDYTPTLTNDAWEIEMKEALKVFDAYGLKVHQTHAPFNRYGQYKGVHKLCLDRCAEATAYMGAKFMAAHGDEFDFDNLTYSPEAALDYNYRMYLPYVEHGEKNGYKVAFETVFEDWDRKRFTSDADELKDMITSFNSESVACCWDSGHAYISFKDKAPEVAKKFGSLIQCTHLHDNTGLDSHQMPMTGNIDWKALMDAFKAINYQGVTNIEYAYGRMAECFMPDFIGLTYKIAEYLRTL